MNENTKIEKFIEEESWLRQPGETNAAYHAFCLYRDYGGDRSLRRALETNNFPLTRLRSWAGWSKLNQWVRRSGDYDKHLDDITRKEREEAYKEQEKLHLSITKKMLKKVDKRLDGFDADELSAGMMMEWTKNTIGLERNIFQKQEEEKSSTKQLEISFFEEFKGI